MCLIARCKCCLPDFNIPPLLQISGTHFQANVIPSWFLAFRSIVLLAMLWITAFDIYICWDVIEWYLIWLSQWTQLICLFTVSVRFISSTMIRFGGDLSKNIKWRLHDPFPSLPRSLQNLYRVQSILTQTSLPMVSLVTLLYWMFIYDPSFCANNIWCTLDQVQIHGGNCLVMWLDHLLSAEGAQFKCLAMILPISVGTLYTIWTLIFQYTLVEGPFGHRYIYSIMDWSDGVKLPLLLWLESLAAGLIIICFGAFTKKLVLKMTWNEPESTDVGESVTRDNPDVEVMRTSQIRSHAVTLESGDSAPLKSEC